MSTTSSQPLAATRDGASAARVDNLGKGGSNHYGPDRAWREARARLWPEFEFYTRPSKRFALGLIGAALRAGIDQFLDLGAGFPDHNSVVAMVRARHPATKVAAVDSDITVARHWAHAIRHGQISFDNTSFQHGDLADPANVLGHARLHGTLDPSKPVCIVLTDVLHFQSDHRSPGTIVSAYQDAVPPGSWLAITHLTADGATKDHTAKIAALAAAYGELGQPLNPRTHTEVVELFGNWKLREPGVVSLPPDDPPPHELGAIRWGGVAVKPA